MHERSSQALAGAVCEVLRNNRQAVEFHDLCAEGFDPLLSRPEIPQNGVVSADIRQHCDELQQADGIVIIHPNWWGQPPAIMKGWIDRVLRPGIAYRFKEGDCGEGIPIGMLKAQTALILNTSNTTEHRGRSLCSKTRWRTCGGVVFWNFVELPMYIAACSV